MGSGDEPPEKLSPGNVFFEHRDLPYIAAVNYKYISQIKNFIPF